MKKYIIFLVIIFIIGTGIEYTIMAEDNKIDYSYEMENAILSIIDTIKIEGYNSDKVLYQYRNYLLNSINFLLDTNINDYQYWYNKLEKIRISLIIGINEQEPTKILEALTLLRAVFNL